MLAAVRDSYHSTAIKYSARSLTSTHSSMDVVHFSPRTCLDFLAQ